MVKNHLFSSVFLLNCKRDFDFGAIFDENTKTIALLFDQKSCIFISLSSQLQKRDFDFGAIFDENTKTIALLFGQKSSIFITLSSQLQKRDFDFGVIFDENTKTIAYFLAHNDPFSSLFLLNRKREILILGLFLMKIPRLSLTFWPIIIHFHHSFFSTAKERFWFGAIFDENTKTIALLFGQKSSIFITLSSQLQKRDFDFGAIFHENSKTIVYFLAHNYPFSSLFLLNC